MKKINHIILFLSLFILCKPTAKAQGPGLLLGMTYSGAGASQFGSIFSYDPISSQFTILYNFNNALVSASQGAQPVGSPIQYHNGMIYGMTSVGGNVGGATGTIFQYNLATGSQTVCVNFTGPNGLYPYGNLIEAKDSMLYGMTNQGGSVVDLANPNGCGVLFRFNPKTDSQTVLYNFNDTNGAAPFASLIQAKDGKLYGMTTTDTSGSNGVLFCYNLITHKDSVVLRFNGANGANPHGSLVQDTNGLIYGMTYQGGLNGGVLFAYNPVTGKDTVLIKLGAGTGYYPYDGALIHDTNGVLYGMSLDVYNGNSGALFRYNPNTNSDTILQAFITGDSGATPYGSPLLASNGLIYAMTSAGGAYSGGELFSFNLGTMQETPLYSFNTLITGSSPYGDLIEAMYVSFIGVDSLKCYGDSNAWAKLNVRGAKFPVTYKWNNGSTADSLGGLKAGADTCVVTDATGKTYTFILNVYQPGPLNANATVQNSCGGSNGVAWAAAYGGTMPYIYNWNNGATTDTITGLAPGNDTCTVTDKNGCLSKSWVKVDTAQKMKIISLTTTPTSCPTCTDGTATVIVTGGIPGGDSALYFYVWTYGGDSAHVAGIPGGVDSVCITSYYGCGSVCDSGFVVTGIAAINDLSNQINIYPNPSSGVFQLIIASGVKQSQIQIFNVLGEKVFTSQYPIPIAIGTNTQYQVDISNEPNGVYTLQVVTAKGIATRKLVIQK